MKRGVALVTYPFTDRVGSTQVQNLVIIARSLFQNIFVIAGELNLPSDSRLSVVRFKRWRASSSLLSSAVNQLLEQMRIAFYLVHFAYKFDFVLLFIGARTYLIPALVSRFLRKRLIVAAAGSTRRAVRSMYAGAEGRVLSFIGNLVENLNYRLADTIGLHFLSPNIVHFFGIERYFGKVTALPYSYIETPLFGISKGISERSNVVGYLGRLSKEKGVMEFVRAIALIARERSNLQFVLVGDGPLRGKIEEELETLGLRQKVRLTGHVANETVPEYLNQMKILVLPSYTEAFGASIEAMACGAICIANRVGGLPDVIADGKTGFLLEDNSPETIARKVVEVLDNPKLEEIQQDARMFVENEFSYERAVELWRRWLRTNIRKDPPSTSVMDRLVQ